jgi:hypothetical protein
MRGSSAPTFSIRSLLFVTFIAGIFLGAFRSPRDEMVFCIVATLIASVAVAWYVVLRDWPVVNSWLLSFAIAAPLFSLDLYLTPSGWSNSAFALVHPQDAAEHAGSAFSGLNKEGVAFDYIFGDGMVLFLAICTATLVGAVRPQRIPTWLICCWVATASASLFLVYDGVAFALSIVNATLLTAAWYAILRHQRTTNLILIAFTSAATCFTLFTRNRIVPEFAMYTLLHVPPTSLSDMHQERYVFQGMQRDCMALWFGSIFALLVAFFARRKSPVNDVEA